MGTGGARADDAGDGRADDAGDGRADDAGGGRADGAGGGRRVEVSAAPTRRSVRLPAFDYGRVGSYFVTLCAWERRSLFGGIRDGAVEVGEVGPIVRAEWERTAGTRAEVELDAFVVMPNHVHGVIRIVRGVRPGEAGRASASARSLSSFVGGFKAAVTSRVRREAPWVGGRVWQRGYYERVVRGERELELIRRYIRSNPVMWRRDAELRRGASAGR